MASKRWTQGFSFQSVPAASKPVMSPTARKARVNCRPTPSTSPEATARPNDGQPRETLALRAASDIARAEANGKAVSAVGWNSIALGTSGQSAAAIQALRASRSARPIAYKGKTVNTLRNSTIAPVKAIAARWGLPGNGTIISRKPAWTERGRTATTARASSGRRSKKRVEACDQATRPGGCVPM